MAASESTTPSNPPSVPRLTRRLTETLRVRELYKYYQPPPPVVIVAGSGNGFLTPSDDPSLTAYAQLIALRLDCQRAIISMIDRSKQYIIAEATRTVTPLPAVPPEESEDDLWLGGREVMSRIGGICQHTIALKSAEGSAVGETPKQNGSNRGATNSPSNQNATNFDLLPMYEVEDLSLEKKFADLPFVVGEPRLRFYCGVPLRTRKGFHIGSLCVVDTQPKRLGDAEKSLLRWMADTVMKHLELKAEKRNLNSHQKMQQSLSNFVAGGWAGVKSSADARTIRNFQNLGSGRAPLPLAGTDRESPGGLNRRITGAKRKILLRANSRASVAGMGDDKRDRPPTEGSTAGTSPNLNVQTPPLSIQNLKRPVINERNSSSSSTASSFSKASMSSSSSSTSVDTTPMSLAAKAKPAVPETIPEPTFKNTFTRASILIQQAMEVDGVIFVDAEEAYWDGNGSPLPTPMASESDEKQLHKHRHTRSSSSAAASRLWTTCKPPSVLGFATEDTSSPFELHIDARSGAVSPPEIELDSGVVGPVRQEFLHELFERYPRGKIFCYDSEGALTSGDEADADSDEDGEDNDDYDCEVDTDPERSLESRKALIADRLEFKRKTAQTELSVFLLGSKSCVFVPLYDYVGRPFAALFTWTNKVTRIFSKDEMGYLMAFTNSIMAEVGRLHTISADRAKGDFISSISHELRSPLHGILASAEFLTDTTLDTFQGSLVETVESCGRTLLDTINHVLDFSKLNTLQTEWKSKSIVAGAVQAEQAHQMAATPAPGKVIDGGALNLVAYTDIAAVTEEVVEGVFAGYEFRGLNTMAVVEHSSDVLKRSGGSSRTPSKEFLTHVVGSKGDITVIIDIDRRDNWNFVTQAGAIRRIIMNIFGNALKYTDRGFVRVRLEAEDFLESDDEEDAGLGAEKTLVTLTVTDSGKGISREFLKTKLFTPFSQENALVSGTGLGMSIVRKIVEILRGTIEVKSEVGLGTEVKVSLIFERAATPKGELTRPKHKRSHSTISSSGSVAVEEADEPDPISQVKRTVAGKKIVVLGFDSAALNLDPIHSRAMNQLRQSLERYAQEWYGMTVVAPVATASLLDYNNIVDVILANESASLMTQLHFKGAKPPMIVLCSNASRYDMYSSQADQGGILDFASKPCGPQKLAKALLFCFNHVEASRRSSNSSGWSNTKAGHNSLPRPIIERNQTSPAMGPANALANMVEESNAAAGAVRFSPPVRSGSSSSEPVVYVPGIGMMASAAGSSAVPFNTGRRRSIPFFEDLQQQMRNGASGGGSPQGEEKLPSDVIQEEESPAPGRKKSITPHLGSFVGLNPPNLHEPPMSIADGHVANRPAMASPVAEKENPLRPKSWGQWQSLDAPVAGLNGMLQPSAATPSAMKAAIEAGERAELQRLLEPPSGNLPPIANGSSIFQRREGSLPSVLIVEDNAINLSLLATFLAKRGYPFEKAENGLIAVQKVTSYPVGFDIIIMDLQMPVMSGIDATRAIRKHEADQGKNERALIIALTGLAAVNDQMEAFASGADMFLSKPVSFKMLQKELEKWYTDKRRRDAASAEDQ